MPTHDWLKWTKMNNKFTHSVNQKIKEPKALAAAKQPAIKTNEEVMVNGKTVGKLPDQEGECTVDGGIW